VLPFWGARSGIATAGMGEPNLKRPRGIYGGIHILIGLWDGPRDPIHAAMTVEGMEFETKRNETKRKRNAVRCELGEMQRNAAVRFKRVK
jgi:hypothetical protein